MSDKDYEALRTMYTRDALAELREADEAETVVAGQTRETVTDDIVEAAIRRAKNSSEDCSSCGTRSEPGAIYCSACGHYLAERCGRCGTVVDVAGARFCVGCGEGLAAA